MKIIPLRRAATAGRVVIIAAALAVIAASPALADAAKAKAKPGKIITGEAVALDGDTLLINGQRVRLWGVDAPEMKTRDGWYARGVLDNLIEISGAAMRCEVRDHDRHKRPVALCREASGVDIGEFMISWGWAVEYRIFTRRGRSANAGDAARYAKAEAQARANEMGRWGGFPRAPHNKRP